MREIYYVKPVLNSRLSPEADPREPRRHLSMTLLGAVVLAAVMFSAWQRFAGLQDGYRVEILQQEKQQILEANRKLRLEEASLGDPLRIDVIARNQLGLTTLSPRQIFSGESGVPAVPVMAQAPPASEPLPAQAKNVAVAVPR